MYLWLLDYQLLCWRWISIPILFCDCNFLVLHRIISSACVHRLFLRRRYTSTRARIRKMYGYDVPLVSKVCNSMFVIIFVWLWSFQGKHCLLLLYFWNNHRLQRWAIFECITSDYLCILFDFEWYQTLWNAYQFWTVFCVCGIIRPLIHYTLCLCCVFIWQRYEIYNSAISSSVKPVISAMSSDG